MVRVNFITESGAAYPVDAEEGESLMRAAVENDVEGVIGECGGSLSCATCHVYVDDDWIARVGAPSEDEEFMLEFAVAPRPTSRLSCQIKLDAGLDGLVVHIPAEQASG